MNVRPTFKGDVDPNKKSFYYQTNKDLVFPREYVSDIEHGFFQGAKYSFNWDLYVRDQEYNYLKEAASELRGEISSRSLPICFNKCVMSLKDLKLSESERSCFIRCYLRRQSSMSDALIYYDTRNYLDHVYGQKVQHELN